MIYDKFDPHLGQDASSNKTLYDDYLCLMKSKLKYMGRKPPKERRFVQREELTSQFSWHYYKHASINLSHTQRRVYIDGAPDTLALSLKTKQDLSQIKGED